MKRISRNPISKVLLVEDDPGDARLLRELFGEQSAQRIELAHVECMHDAERHLAEHAVDVILLDLGLRDIQGQGLAAVRRVRAAAPRVALVVLTGLDDESQASKALQEGAQDHLIKGQIDWRDFDRALRYAIERKQMEEAVIAEYERAQLTLNCIGDAVASTDSAGNITFLNLVAERISGWSREEAMGRPMEEVFHIVDAASRVVVADPMAKAVEQDRAVHIPYNSLLVRRDGSEVPIEDSVAPIHDREGRQTGAVIVFRDVSAARAMALQIIHSAEHDCLTDLPNRLLFYDRVTQGVSLARRNAKQIAVLFLDLDGFKHINDSLGHAIGDKLLQSIAARLVGCVRDSDTVSRQGGDEFVVLLSEVEHPEDAAVAAIRMLQAVAEAHCIDEHVLHVTTSIGVSVYPDDGTEAESLIRNADTAMYQAKEDGRHGYRFFTPEMNARAVESLSMEAVRSQSISRHFSVALRESG